MHPDTLSVHAGNVDDLIGSVVPPINLSTTFERDEAGNIGGKGFIYTRMDNPNRRALETKLALLEAGEEAIAFPSGNAAALAIAESVLEPGMHLIMPDDCYHGIASLIKNMLARWKVSHTEVDMTDPRQVEKVIQKNTGLILLETPSNPMLKITDIEAVSSIAKAHGILVACDNTWTTALIQRPLELGVDLVFHSSTKFFGGHSDILGGVVIVKKKNAVSQRLREFQVTGGVVPSPFDCWLLNRSLATLSLRLGRQVQNALTIVDFLKTHPRVEKIYYPGLPDHPNHAVAKRQMNGNFGSMISIQVKGGEKESMRFAGRLRIFKHATSLGGVESLIEHRRTAEGQSPKSPDNLLRLSIGVEYIDDLIADLKNGFNG
ncbi:MAG: aminotransferase class I/II-fold pyridoxal phosphate-dependent enzyme [Bacteroidota bacterium]|nr:aminotransferase class I/II-fold pyridoxal phosphate-dependent enzyme [Bacteroidota bacterium]MDP4250601.1 aminotransferase class I/II-fold pyridoxal phosphate-dependent enzyme [Bacteroidota bacterium]